MRGLRVLAVVVGCVGVAGVAGCRVDRSASGDHVSMRTPVGGLEVRTDEQAMRTSIGLPVYPGAEAEQEKDGKKKDAADVDLQFGNLRLRVKALSYRVDAAPEEVQAFYAKELGRFGVVITCQDHRTVGTPARTPEGLTCDQKSSTGMDNDVNLDKEHDVQLKAGSPQHQRVVAVEPEGHGTKFALVLLDLPKGLGVGDAGR